MITFTERAIAQARIYQATHPETAGQLLRVWIADKNCDGFQYGVAFDTPIEGDQVLDVGGLEVLIDPGTALHIGGSDVDYVDDERGRGFLVQNPRASDFRGKFFLKSRP
jgi:iron-sulfur cluster assembly accessory protein